LLSNALQNRAKTAPAWRACPLFSPADLQRRGGAAAAGRLNFAQMGFHLVFILIFAIGFDVAYSLQYLFRVSRDTPLPGAYFEQVTFQRIGSCL